MPIHKGVNQNFFKIWTPEMAYTLGFLFADGSIIRTNRSTHFVSFHSADKSLLLKIKGAMDSRHKISKRSPRSGEVYRLQIGSRVIFEDLTAIGLVVNKSKRLKPVAIPRKVFGDFVRGYFDGDGNVWSGFVNIRRKKPTKTIQVAFTSGSVNFLYWLLGSLKLRGILGGSIYRAKNGNYGRLKLSTLDALRVYKIMYNMPNELYLRRKKRVFDRFIKMRL